MEAKVFAATFELSEMILLDEGCVVDSGGDDVFFMDLQNKIRPRDDPSPNTLCFDFFNFLYGNAAAEYDPSFNKKILCLMGIRG